MELNGQNITIAITIIGGLFAFYRWIITRKDKSRAEQNKSQDEKLQEHKERLDRHRELITEIAESVRVTREDMHNGYVKTGAFLESQKSIDAKLDEMFKRQSAIARDLNQAIGNMKATNEAEIKDLIKGIQDVIGKPKSKSPE